MSTQQDIYEAGSENRPPMLNKENYVPWSSRLLRYAKSRPNGKLIHNSIRNGPYVRRMTPEPGDTNREVPVNETFHIQTDDELTEKELKQIEADDQAIQTILLGSDIRIQEKKAKLFNEWERFTSSKGESIESYYHRFLKLMNDLKRNKHIPKKIASNLKFLNNLQPEWSQHVTIVHQTNDLHTADYTQLYDFLKYNQKENLHGNGNLVAVHAEGNVVGHNGNQIRCYNCRGVGHFARNCTAKDFDLMAVAADLDEIEEVNANCSLMANMQKASTSGTQTDKAPIYDSDRSTEVHDYENYDDNEIYNMFTQEEQYTELLEPIPKQHQVPHNDNNIISENLAIEVEKVNSVNPKFVGDFKSLAKEADESLAKHKALELEIERLLRAVFSQDIMSVVQNNSVVDTSNLPTKLERTKERYETVSLKRRMNMLNFRMIGTKNVIQRCLWCVDSGCSKHITGNLKLLINFVWKFMGTVRFENDHVAAIMGFGQFCDLDLEVAFRRNACFVRNLKGVDLLKGDRLTNLYTINLHEMASASPICLMAHASSTKSWLRHQRLSHLNFDTTNDLARNNLVSGLPKFKFYKEHLCPSCEQGKGKRASHPPKPVPNSRQRLHLLHMDLCGPMRIASINGKRITILLQSPVIIIRTDNGTKFKNQVLNEYFDSVGISHQMSSVRTPQQNGVVERRNQTLVEAARTMLIFSCASLFLWAEAIATACFTQNRSIIHRRFNKTPYELINGRKPYISFLHVFRALCYPKNDREDIGKLGATGDIGFFIGYSADSCTYRIYNRRTKKIIETMNVSFDELSAMAFEQHSSKPGLQSMTSGQISSGLDLTYASSTITILQPTKGELDFMFEAMYDDYIGSQPSASTSTISAAQEPQVRQTSTASTSIADTAPTPTNSSSQAIIFPNTSQDFDELNSQQQHVSQQGIQAHFQSKTVAENVLNALFDGNIFVNPFANPSISAAESSLITLDNA
nr:hypothetical protein [Tanacetum cinerariifolium]